MGSILMEKIEGSVVEQMAPLPPIIFLISWGLIPRPLGRLKEERK
jgi:hypothetical protein